MSLPWPETTVIRYTGPTTNVRYVTTLTPKQAQSKTIIYHPHPPKKTNELAAILNLCK